MNAPTLSGMVLCLALALIPGDAAAQTSPEIVGRSARLWPMGTQEPIGGRVRFLDDSRIGLETNDVHCGVTGCARSFSLDLANVSRLEVGRRTSRDRALIAGAVGLGLGLLLGPALSSCGERPTPDSRDRCEYRTVAMAFSIGALGYGFARQSWVEVPVPR